MKKILINLVVVLFITFFCGNVFGENINLFSGFEYLDISEGSITLSGMDDGAIQYTQNGTIKTTSNQLLIRQADSSTSTGNTITVLSGEVDVSIANINISSGESPIRVCSNALLTLNLIGESTVVSSDYNAAVEVTDTASIIFSGSGIIAAIAKGYGAGIGSSYAEFGSIYAEKCGTIIINSGTIIASSWFGGAGIGSGSGATVGGTIIINGGTVNASSDYLGAGIGGRTSKIIINDGTVTANGGEGDPGDAGAGIGGSGSDIIINGGTIVATGGQDYYGGWDDDYYGAAGIDAIGGTIIIKNADITAVGYSCAIGGSGLDNKYGCESLTIENSKMNVTYLNSKGSEYLEKIYNLSSFETSYSALDGNYVTLIVEAHAASGISYQWQISNDNAVWTDIDGQTFSTANIKLNSENDGYYYRCKLSNNWGNEIYTASTQCMVLRFTKQPESVEAEVGDLISLEAESLCKNVTYQWERSLDNGITYLDVYGEKYNTLITIADLSQNDSLYRCVITADNGDQLVSDAAKIKVKTNEAYYVERYYLQSPDNDDYIAYEQNAIIALVGTNVVAEQKIYDGFTENTSLGISEGKVTNNNSLVLERYYDRNKYIIEFETNGGVVLPTLEAKYEQEIVLPKPSRYGYSFEGWYEDAELTNKTEIKKMPINGTILYAKWKVNDSDMRDCEYRINALTVKNPTTYETLSDIPDASFIAEISVTNISSKCTDTIIMATYDNNGLLKDITYMYASIGVGETSMLGTLLKNSDGEVAKIKAYVWNNLVSINPLSNVVEYVK